MFSQTFMRGIEQRRIVLGALALHHAPYTTPISAPVVVYLNHDTKQNKDNAAADNRTSTYSTSVLLDPQLHLGLHFWCRLGGKAGRPLTEAEADSGAWCDLSPVVVALCSMLSCPHANQHALQR